MMAMHARPKLDGAGVEMWADPRDATHFTRMALLPMTFTRRRGPQSFCAGGDHQKFGSISMTRMWSRGGYVARPAHVPLPSDQILLTLCLSGSCEMQGLTPFALRAGHAIIMPCA